VGLDAVVLAEPRAIDVLLTDDDDRLAQPAVLGEVVHEQAGDLELVEERALLVGAPARSASPSSSSPRSKPPPAMLASASSTFGRIGSG
jgi:hypothetical protein